MKYAHSELTQHTMVLKLMGADISTISSEMVYVSFKITDEIEVSYVYNVNRKDKYFLERIKPYPVVVKEFQTAKEVIDLIKLDVEQFRNAVLSHKVSSFIEVNKSLHKSILSFEDLFLYYNVDQEHIDVIQESIDNINAEIKKAAAKSKRVFLKKEPDNL